MVKWLKYFILLSTIIACEKSDTVISPSTIDDVGFISAVDISRYPEIEESGQIFYGRGGNQNDFLGILKENGVNTVRLRLWVNPANQHSGFDEVKTFSQRLKSLGFKTWLTIHYSDTWADPGHQTIPLQWQGISYSELKDSVQAYSQLIAEELKPDLIQIGNEINSGFLHPIGNLTTNPEQFKELMSIAIQSVRDYSPGSKIIIHFAGIENSEWFYTQVGTLDYDFIGLSYYPIWHGKSLDKLKDKMDYLSHNFDKEIIIAETAYPFTLEWNDWTNNIVGLDEHLILPSFPATNQGQAGFVNEIKSIAIEVEKGIGFCYWGAELIAWKGAQATDASSWENQALFNFENKALPALEEFKNE